ncbi:hypothetical protein LTR27_011314 [Elasticomyces elasticus]|nr:hypothetical protein LTR27_011314 [Elasticomyces elasticus]
MDAHSSTSSLPGTRPHTPPYTPYRSKAKRRHAHLASNPQSRASSVHPTETVSPPKKHAKRSSAEKDDAVHVEELAEQDAASMSDTEIVYPASFEDAASTANSDGDDELSSSDDDDKAVVEGSEDAGGLTRRMSRLHCTDDDGEAQFEQGRRQRRMSKRLGSRIFKRSHSQSMTEEAATEADADMVDDHDLEASRRRLRRRTRGPEGNAAAVEEVPRSSHKDSSKSAALPITPQQDGAPESWLRRRDAEAMEVDGMNPSAAILSHQYAAMTWEQFMDAFGRMRAVIPAIERLRTTFLSHNLPVIFTRLGLAEHYSHSGLVLEAQPRIKELRGFVRGTWDADVVDDMAPTDNEVVVDKTRTTCFHGMDLAERISELGLGQSVVMGVGANVCVESTVPDAFTRGFRVVKESDATAALTVAERDASLASLM